MFKTFDSSHSEEAAYSPGGDRWGMLEIATTDYTTTKQALEAGADRIELTSALSEGGITPSLGIIKLCIENFKSPINVMIRPRGGDFLYTTEEIDIMKKDIQACKQLGMNGVVYGILNKDGSINKNEMKRLADIAYPLSVTCHRAFDRCRDAFEALEDLIDIGCERILTSGQKEIVPEGVQLITELVKAADERIIIMPGSGIRAHNIKQIAEATGAREFHTSARMKTISPMDFIHPAFANSEEVYLNAAIDTNEIKSLKEALKSS